MRTKFIEATQPGEATFNHGKFMVGLFDADEWLRVCEIDKPIERSLLYRCGWHRDHVLVLDLQTGEGAIFMPGGLVSADLDKHKVWVCPMFEPFLGWLYTQHERFPDESWFESLPSVVEVEAEAALYGYRRPGL